MVNLPVDTSFRPLYLSANSLEPNAKITVAAAQLPLAPSHDVLYVLQGPQYRSEHLVATAGGVAVGIVSLPAQLQKGNWYLAVLDFSGVHASGTKLTGQVLVEASVFSVK